MRPDSGLEYELVVRGGTVVTAGGAAECDLGISNGTISQVGGPLRGRRELDAAGAFVLPGGLDMHVHLSYPEPPPDGGAGWADDFETGSAAAIAGGVTTIGNMTFPAKGDSLSQALARDLESAGQAASVDYVLHSILYGGMPGAVDELPLLADTARQLLAAGRGGLADWAASRPVAAERAAVERAVAICEATRAPIYIVHLSSQAALEAARAARARGLPVFVETRPIYLYLTGSVLAQPDGGRFIGAPPLREAADVAALWAGLADGSIDTLGSDHAPWELSHKIDPSLDVTTARQGVADLETMLPMLFSEGVRTGRISLERFVALTAANPARLFGLYPRKGTIAVGSDADLLILDPQVRRTIDGRSMRSRAGYSAYDGHEVYGWPRFTVRRGEVVLADGEVLAQPGSGQWLSRGPAPTCL
jgi:dihydropyrimidinase